jgi:hypothetical protein
MTNSYSVEIGESMSEEVNQCQGETIMSGTDKSTPGILDALESALERFRLVAHDFGDPSTRCPPSRHFSYV